MVGDQFEVPVAVEGSHAGTWAITVQRPQDRSIVLALADPHGRAWEARGGDVFDALMNLRCELEPAGIQVCCNGARRNAWSSGMQRDMGVGETTYLLTLGEHGVRPPSVKTLEPAPLEDVGSVAEQRAFYEAWLAELGQ